MKSKTVAGSGKRDEDSGDEFEFGMLTNVSAVICDRILDRELVAYMQDLPGWRLDSKNDEVVVFFSDDRNVLKEGSIHVRK